MGIALANQRFVTITHIIEFKENLRVLLISALFIILAARLKLEDLLLLNWTSLVFLAILVLVARPVSVMLCTIRSKLSWKERLFVGWMAPRGIVAAAVASVFALRLEESGYVHAERLISITFLVIIGTVTIYGLTSGPLARLLKVAQPHPQGLLIVGAPSWARKIASLLKAEGTQVLLVDTNLENVEAAKAEGLVAYYGSILSEHILDEIELGGIGRLIALTANDEVNSLACLRFATIFGRAEVYQLPLKSWNGAVSRPVSHEQTGRFLFDPRLNFSYLNKALENSTSLKVSKFDNPFGYVELKAGSPEKVVPLFLLTSTSNNNPIICSTDRSYDAKSYRGAIYLTNSQETAIEVPSSRLFLEATLQKY